MRTNPVWRWIFIGLIPWIGTMLLAAELVRNQNGSALQPNVKQELKSDQTTRAEWVALHVSGQKNCWALPVNGPRDGWLVAVGTSTPGARPQRLSFGSRSVASAIAGEAAKGDALLPQSNLSKPFVSKTFTPIPGRPMPKSVATPVRLSRSFSIQTRSGDSSDPAFYESVDAELAKSGLRANVYVDRRDRSEVRQETVETIVRIMDEVIPTQVVPRIGDAADTDGDSRLTILISQALGRMADGAAVLDGFVRPADFDLNVPAPRGQACDMIYINSRVSSPEFLKSLLAHEFTHAVVASARLRSSAGDADESEESWLDEGLAHLSERWVDGSWENLDYRVSSYLFATHEHPLVVNESHGLGAARGHGHRGAAFLFLSWCQAKFGPGLPMKLAQSARSGLANLEAATGENFANLFRAWSADLLERSANLSNTNDIRVEALLNEWLVATPKAGVQLLNALGESAPEPTEWQAPPTTVRLFRIEPGPEQVQNGQMELALDCETPQTVQVTVLRLTDQHHGLAVEAVRAGGSSPSEGGSAQVRLTFTNRDRQRPLTLQAAAWEELSKTSDARILRQNRGFFDLLMLARMTGTIRLDPGQSLVTPPITLDPLVQPSGTIVWKVVAHDPNGKPSFAWAQVHLEPTGLFPPRLADSIGLGSPRTLRR